MGLLGDGPVGHGPRFEPAYDLLHRLYLRQGEGDPAGGVKFHAPPEGVPAVPSVYPGAVGLEKIIPPGPDRPLQGKDGHRVIEVTLVPGAAAQFLDPPAVDGGVGGQVHGVKGPVVAGGHRRLDGVQTHPAHLTGGVGKEPGHQIPVQAHRLKTLGALVGLEGGDPHLRRHRDHPRQDGPVIVGHGGIEVLVQQSFVDEFGDTLVGQVGVHRPGAVAQQGGHLVHVPGFPALQNDGDRRALSRLDEVLLQDRHRQQGGDGHVVLIHPPVREDQQVGPTLAGLVTPQEQLGQGRYGHIRPHGEDGLLPLLRHGQDRAHHILIGVAKHGIELIPGGLVMAGHPVVGHRQLVQGMQLPVQPLPVRVLGGVGLFEAPVSRKGAGAGIHYQHLAGTQAGLADHLAGGQIQHPHFRGQHHPAI